MDGYIKYEVRITNGEKIFNVYLQENNLDIQMELKLFLSDNDFHQIFRHECNWRSCL